MPCGLPGGRTPCTTQISDAERTPPRPTLALRARAASLDQPALARSNSPVARPPKAVGCGRESISFLPPLCGMQALHHFDANSTCVLVLAGSHGVFVLSTMSGAVPLGRWAVMLTAVGMVTGCEDRRPPTELRAFRSSIFEDFLTRLSGMWLRQPPPPFSSQCI